MTRVYDIIFDIIARCLIRQLGPAEVASRSSTPARRQPVRRAALSSESVSQQLARRDGRAVRPSVWPAASP